MAWIPWPPRSTIARYRRTCPIGRIGPAQLEQMSFEEISAVAGISTDAATMNFHHGLKRRRSDAPEE